MGVCVALLVATVVAISHAGRLPYFGGDIDELIENSKQTDYTDPAAAWIVSNTAPVEPKPITMKQKRDSTNYNSKFTDIARAYAEGYKAAIKAVQQRAIIAKRRLQGLRPYPPMFPYRPNQNFARSIIPGVPGANPEAPNLQAPAPLVPKSIIPSPTIPEQIPGIQQSKEVISPGPSSEQETHTLPTLNDLTDNKASKEEMVSRSTIPLPSPQDIPKEEKKSVITSESTSNLFSSAQPSQVTENAVEKSWIPNGPSSPSDNPLTVNERSTHLEMPKYIQDEHPAFSKVSVHMRSNEDRDKIAKMNARARHRNIYFDGAGGDPFNGGGVLSVQNAVSLTKKHRRRRRRSSEEEYYVHMPRHQHTVRYRRSHMPYLGQNLDALGVVRATPKSWTSAQVRKSLELKSKPSFAAPSTAYNSPEMSASPFTQAMPAAFRAEIPQPPMTMMGPPMAMSYGQMFQNQQPQFSAYRNMIPNYPSFYNQMPGPFGFPFQSPLPSGLIGEDIPNVESSDGKPEEIREKKSTIPTPEDQDPQTYETVTFNA